MKKKRCQWLLAVILVFAMLTGCGGAGSSEETKSAEKETTAAASNETKSDASEAITITDLDGKEYTFDKPLDKVIVQWSGAGGPFMTMAALFGEEFYQHIAAIDNTLQDNRADMYEQYVKDVPGIADIPMVKGMDSDEFDMELALSCGAEAAIVPIGLKASIQDSVQPKLEAAGIPVIYIDYHAETRENHIQSTEIMGKLFGKEDRAQELIDFYTGHVDPIFEKVEEILKTEERPTVYVEVGMNGPDEYGNSNANGYMWGAMIYNAGGYSIATDVLESAGAVEPEFVLSSNPENIIFAGSYWPANATSIRMGFQADEATTRELVDAYLARPGWSELDAVKNNEISVLHHGVAREIYDCSSQEAVAKAIWPEEFADLDPTATLKEYYDTFLPFEFSGLWYLEY